MELLFDSNLRLLRNDFHLSQLQLADETKLAKSSISYWEMGTDCPNAKAIIILARYFQVSIDYFLKLSNDSSTVYRTEDLDVDLTLFCNRLKELRLKKNLSQCKLSNIVKITQPAINYWEQGKRIPNAKSIITLAKFFEVTTDYLLGESD